MKLQAISEAKYHIDPNLGFLNNYFEKEDEDVDGSHTFQWWKPKNDLHIKTEFEDEDHEVTHVIAVHADGEESVYDIYISGFEEPVSNYGHELEHLEVFKQLYP